MIDQSISNGKYINFLGHPAKTSMVIPKIALKYNALIIPAFAIRSKHVDFVEVFIEPSVKLTTEEDIMLNINRSLEKKILQYPHQWYWVHNRWK